MHTTIEHPGPADTLAGRILSEQQIGVQSAARLLRAGRGGRPTRPATLTRWISTGAAGPGGGRVKLEAVRVGSRWVTSRGAVARFVEALTPATADGPMLRTPSARRRSSEEAEAELIAAGC